MRYKRVLNRKPCTIEVNVFCKREQPLIVKIEDNLKPNTVYADRLRKIKGKGKFYIRLPQTPKVAKISIYNKLRGNKKARQDSSFSITSIKKIDLKRKFSVDQIQNPITRKFVKFAQWFSDKAGILDCQKAIYISDSGEFRIDYVPNVTSRDDGHKMNTPARINKKTGIIEIARNSFVNYTIPMRMAILLHEFSHFYLNKDMDNETEADTNALLVYLGLGYSRVEAIKVFLSVFHGSATDGNVERYKIIENMINNFEKAKIKFNSKSNYYYDGEV